MNTTQFGIAAALDDAMCASYANVIPTSALDLSFDDGTARSRVIALTPAPKMNARSNAGSHVRNRPPSHCGEMIVPMRKEIRLAEVVSGTDDIVISAITA